MNREPELTESRLVEIREVVLDEVRGRSLARRPRRVTLVALGAAASFAVAGSAAAWVNARRPPDPFLAYCAEVVTADRAVWSQRAIGSAFVQGGTRSPLQAVETCEQMWRQGIVGDGHTVPTELTPCLLEEQLVVYPGGPGTCRQVGGEPADLTAR